MIDKELEEVVNEELFDSRAKKGYNSEKQMAFYLKRKFFDNPEIHVLNNLNIKTVNQEGFFQIDHLIITKYCFIIVESKTSNSHLKYDDNLQWSCFEQTTQKWVGIKSPMVQAEMQGDALRKVLQENRENLRMKRLNMQGGFITLPIHTLVAVSDSGIIDYGESNEEYRKNVLKADLIPKRIVEIFENYKKSDSKINAILDKAPDYVLPDKDVDKIIQYILELHHVKAAYLKLEYVPLPKCEACNNSFGIQYNSRVKLYELVCKKCGQVKRMNYKCQKCGGELKIRMFNRIPVVGCETCDKYGKLG